MRRYLYCIIPLIFLCSCATGGYNPSYIISEGEEALQTKEPPLPEKRL